MARANWTAAPRVRWLPQFARPRAQVTEQELGGVEARLRTINEGAQIRRASKANVDVSFVTGLNMQDTHSVVAEVSLPGSMRVPVPSEASSRSGRLCHQPRRELRAAVAVSELVAAGQPAVRMDRFRSFCRAALPWRWAALGGAASTLDQATRAGCQNSTAQHSTAGARPLGLCWSRAPACPWMCHPQPCEASLAAGQWLKTRCAV